MKRICAFVLFITVLFTLCACGGNDTYSSVCKQLEKTSMSGTEYSQTQIQQFESRFSKMNLEEGFSRVNHFRSKSQYAYVIEFENTNDAQVFFETVGKTPTYNVKKLGSVVVYGESKSIDNLK